MALKQAGVPRIAFVSYYKGDNGVHVITPEKPVAVVAANDFGSPGPVFDFTAPISHTLLKDNIHRKGAWEKMSLAGRPPVSLGVTSGGNFYGNTQVTFTDVLGDKEVSFYAQSIAQYRTTAFTYVNMERRLQYALQGFSSDTFYYGQQLENSGALYDPAIAPFISRSNAQSVSSQRGGTIFAIYPFNRYSRLEIFTGFMHLNEQYTDPTVQAAAVAYQTQIYGQPLLRNGNMLPFGLSFVKETTVFRDFGPLAGGALKVSYNGSPSISNSWISRQTVDGDARLYKRLAANGVFALRFRGLKSWGRNPDFLYFGGNSEVHGYSYLQFIGQKAFFADAELRFPLIEAMLTPLGVLGGLRGVFFANLGAAGFNGQPFSIATGKTQVYNEITGYDLDLSGNITATHTTPVQIGGFRLVDGRASYGFGLESFLLGFPIHFDWSWKTLLNKAWEDALFPTCTQTGAITISCTANADSFRKRTFDFWIGYDF